MRPSVPKAIVDEQWDDKEIAESKDGEWMNTEDES